METLMNNSNTTMKLFYNDGWRYHNIIRSLTYELATSGYGYKISNTGAPISNLFYMNDLKLYSKNYQEQVGELKIVTQFSDDIGMGFGLEKCAKASLVV